ncbi:TVP38/TMEM64 family protein, partial [Candidatus Woesebacteria bacterium]|nr:TVP38/TMEM64 family protein [Candidatus Woesebacteria bacterium]
MKKTIISGISILIVLLAIIFLRSVFPEEYVQKMIITAGPLGPLVYILLSISVYIFAPFLAPPLVYVGFYAFGRNVVWYASIASFICFFTNFWIARLWGRSWVEKMVGKSVMKKVDIMSKNYGLTTLFFLRAFQGGMNDVISYVGGLTSIPFRSYLIVSTLGLIPGALLWYWLSLAVHDSVEFFVVSTGMSIFLS